MPFSRLTDAAITNLVADEALALVSLDKGDGPPAAVAFHRGQGWQLALAADAGAASLGEHRSQRLLNLLVGARRQARFQRHLEDRLLGHRLAIADRKSTRLNSSHFGTPYAVC